MGKISGSSIAILLLVTYVTAIPLQLQGGMDLIQEDYGPTQPEYLRYYDDRGFSENLDGISGGHLLRQTRRGLDSLSGTDFNGNKRLLAARRTNLLNKGNNLGEIDRSSYDRFAKRNIDEIDRTAFDSFFKRNFDEIDRVGWNGFVKRLEADLAADRQRF